MNRRSFIKTIGAGFYAAAAPAILLPEVDPWDTTSVQHNESLSSLAARIRAQRKDQPQDVPFSRFGIHIGSGTASMRVENCRFIGCTLSIS